ncbi:SIMPL domain-containing protein [Actinomadura sp. 6N118]|uniref:SIMPL domain-containing protein n=1 Tax=Actinomadura sp. 6N118 TaxID=3375151 RepID=UPI00379C9919
MIRRLVVPVTAALVLTAALQAGSPVAGAAALDREDRMEAAVERGAPTAPDIVYVLATVEVRRDRVMDAYQAVTSATAQLKKTMADSGVAARDMWGTQISVHPEYGPGEPRRVVGYRGTGRVKVTVRGLDRARATQRAIRAANEDVQVEIVTVGKQDWSP